MKLLFYEAAAWVTPVIAQHAAGTSGHHMHQYEDCKNGPYPQPGF